MELPVWFEIATFVGLTVLLLADLAIVARRPHEPSMKEAGLWVSFYVSLALLFGLVIAGGHQRPVRHRVLRGLADRVLASRSTTSSSS